MVKEAYNRVRNCQNLHNFNNSDVKRFVEIGEVPSGMVVLDAMCGDGIISEELVKKNVDLYLLDKSEFQINLAKKKIKGAKFFVKSLINSGFESERFDRVFIRNGIYEFPKKEQVRLYKEIYRILKKGGRFINWTFKLSEGNQKEFNEIVRKKDSLAGFEELVKNRYFMSESELLGDLKEVGFSVEVINIDIYYTLSTKKWFDIDFEGDKNKLDME